jgi:aminoglycoside phosphotransferase family enzyme
MLPAADDQAAVIEFLSSPASYGVASAVQRIDTHCSIVFLVEDRAYKLKRAIRYAALDYTTRELRQAACAAELWLNRRTAPDLYLGVRSVTYDRRGHLTFDGTGAALDQVVVMRRFDQSDLFDRMALTRRLTLPLMRALGEAVADLHRIAERTPQHGGAEAIRRVIADNEVELAKVAEELDGAAVGTLGGHARAWLDRLAAVLDARRDEGKVRRCHGDLRLANICLYRGRPTLFDCIEFSDEIGCIDVLYDLAFLLMDLWHRGCHDQAALLFNRYLDRTCEDDGMAAIPLFLSMRAAVRAHVGASVADASHGEDQTATAAARDHEAAALGFLGLGAQPPLPEWGTMIATARRFILDQWWVPVIPGIAIFVASLAFNLLGDGLRDVLDPRMRVQQ